MVICFRQPPVLIKLCYTCKMVLSGEWGGYGHCGYRYDTFSVTGYTARLYVMFETILKDRRLDHPEHFTTHWKCENENENYCSKRTPTLLAYGVKKTKQ